MSSIHAKAFGAMRVVHLLSPTSELFSLAHNWLKQLGADLVAYDGKDPRGELQGVEELLDWMQENYTGTEKLGNASSIVAELEKLIQELPQETVEEEEEEDLTEEEIAGPTDKQPKAKKKVRKKGRKTKK